MGIWTCQCEISHAQMESADHAQIWRSTTPKYGVCRSCPNMEINHPQIWSLQIMPKYGDQPPTNMESADYAQIWRSTTHKYGVCRLCPNMEIDHIQIWSLQIMPKYGDRPHSNM